MKSTPMGDAAVAAAARAAAYGATDRARSSRPQSRASAVTGLRKAALCSASRANITPSTEDEMIRFEGEASVYEAGYAMRDSFGEYIEVVARGAAAKSLARPDLDVPFVLQHDSLRRIASTVNGTLRVFETENGLQVSADLDPTDHDVQYILPKLRNGLIAEMSFRFSIDKGEWNEDYSVFRIDQFDIHRGDVAIVGYGANPATSGGLADPKRPVDALVALAATGGAEVRAFLAAVAGDRAAREALTGDTPRAPVLTAPVPDAIMALLGP